MTRIKTLLLLGTALLLAAAVSACGGSDSSDQAATAPAPAAATATATPTSAPKSEFPTSGTPKKSTEAGSAKSSDGAAPKAVEISNFAFGPSNVTVKVGQKVTWTNQDDAPHTVTGGELDSPNLAKGASFSFTPTKAGTIAYICSIHPSMKGTLTVQ